MGFSMLELNNSFASLIVFTINGRFVNRPPFDTDLTVRSVLPEDGYFRVPTGFLDQVSPFFKLDCSRLVVIEDSNFHNARSTQAYIFTVSTRNQCQFDEKFFIGLPLVVVHNFKADLLGTFVWLKS